jgi:hypothetical protein
MLFFTTNYTNFSNSFLNTDYMDYTDIYRFAVLGVPLRGRNFIKLNSILFKIYSIFGTYVRRTKPSPQGKIRKIRVIRSEKIGFMSELFFLILNS